MRLGKIWQNMKGQTLKHERAWTTKKPKNISAVTLGSEQNMSGIIRHLNIVLIRISLWFSLPQFYKYDSYSMGLMYTLMLKSIKWLHQGGLVTKLLS